LRDNPTWVGKVADSARLKKTNSDRQAAQITQRAVGLTLKRPKPLASRSKMPAISDPAGLLAEIAARSALRANPKRNRG
jgi:hypothetical protein